MDVLNTSADFLVNKAIENPRLNAEMLLAHALNVARMDLYLQYDRPLNQQERETFKTLLRRRAACEPLQYILGETEFMSLPFQVSTDVLIPRPETETLVEAVLNLINDSEQPVSIIDIGTGSGIIAVSLAHYLPRAQVTAVDKFPEALNMARSNARLNHVEDQINFLQMDIMQTSALQTLTQPFDFLISNPPYVTLEEFKELPREIREFEPEDALTDHGDGLIFYRQIAAIGKKLVKPGGHLMVEVGDKQSESVQALFAADHGYTPPAALPDLNGIHRVIHSAIL